MKDKVIWLWKSSGLVVMFILLFSSFFSYQGPPSYQPYPAQNIYTSTPLL